MTCIYNNAKKSVLSLNTPLRGNIDADNNIDQIICYNCGKTPCIREIDQTQ